jgi:hypothetical protein
MSRDPSKSRTSAETGDFPRSIRDDLRDSDRAFLGALDGNRRVPDR